MYHNSNYAWLYLIQGNITAVPVKYALDDILVKFFWTKECSWTYVMHHVSFSSKIFAENFALGHFGSRLQSIWSFPFPRWGRTHTNSCRCEIPNCGYICKYFHPFIKYFHSAPFMKFWWIYLQIFSPIHQIFSLGPIHEILVDISIWRKSRDTSASTQSWTRKISSKSLLDHAPWAALKNAKPEILTVAFSKVFAQRMNDDLGAFNACQCRCFPHNMMMYFCKQLLFGYWRNLEI